MKVLFVDDNEMNRKVIKGMLGAADVPMTEAEDAESGLEIFDVETFDVVLMDIRMPGMDGLAAIREIRARTDERAAVPIIVVTADNGPDIRGQALAAGADELLHKPVQMQELFDTLGSVIERKRRRGSLLA